MKRKIMILGASVLQLPAIVQAKKMGLEVIAVDMSQKIVNDVAAYLPVCKCADVTDGEVISRLGIGNIDTVIICMAGNLEASVMADRKSVV